VARATGPVGTGNRPDGYRPSHFAAESSQPSILRHTGAERDNCQWQIFVRQQHFQTSLRTGPCLARSPQAIAVSRTALGLRLSGEIAAAVACLRSSSPAIPSNRWEALLLSPYLHRLTRCIWWMSSTDDPFANASAGRDTRLCPSADPPLLIVIRPVRVLDKAIAAADHRLQARGACSLLAYPRYSSKPLVTKSPALMAERRRQVLWFGRQSIV